MKSLFEQLVDEIDAAIVDVTLSKIPKGEKAKKLRMLIQARDYQLQVAGIMDQIYPESQLCAASNSPAECKSLGCVNVVHCEGKALKRLMIEGRIIRAIDEQPEEPICNCKEHRTDCMNQRWHSPHMAEENCCGPE